jgi:Flagellin and related hook-associated proteins
MAFSVVTNNNALAALQALNNTQRSMTMTQNRITTGMKVAGAADNASTFTIAQGMRGDISGLKAASQSIALGKSTVGVALSAAEQISNKLNELKGKVTEGQAQNVDLAKIQQDMDSIVSSIDDIVNAAQFNGVNLLDGGLGGGLDVLTGLNRTSATAESIASYTVASQDLTTATGLSINNLDVTTSGQSTFTPGSTLAVADGDTITLTAGGIAHTFEFTDGSAALTTNETATIDAHAVLFVAGDTTQQRLAKAFDVMRDAGFTVNTNEDGSFSVANQQLTATATTVTGLTAGATASTAAAAFDAVNTAIDTVNAAVAALGTSSNSLDASAKFVSSLTDALTTGVGQLVDADMAEESANLQALQTRQQLGIQALSIANSQPGSILALFRG